MEALSAGTYEATLLCINIDLRVYRTYMLLEFIIH